MSFNETVMKDLLRIIPKKGKVVEGECTRFMVAKWFLEQVKLVFLKKYGSKKFID